MEYLSFIWEIALLGIGLYIFLFGLGVLKAKSPEKQVAMDEMRASLNPWVTILAALMVLFSGISLLLHIYQSIQ